MEISGRQFGLLIAYLLPGFIGMAGVAPLSPVVTAWLQGQSLGTAGVSPSLFMLMGAVTLGLIISCFRWLLIDSVLHRMGVHRPVWKDHRLDESLEAFDYLVENHYRYYQFYANSLMAILWSYSVHRAVKSSTLLGYGTDLGAMILCAVLFAGARDTLAKYYQRTSRLIGHVAEKDRDVMTNGNHVAESAGSTKIPSINPANPRKEPVEGKHEASKPKPTQAKE